MLVEDFGLAICGAFGFGTIEVGFGFALGALVIGTDEGLGDGVDRPESANLFGGLSVRLHKAPI